MRAITFILALFATTLLAASPAFAQVYVRGAANIADVAGADQTATGSVGVGYDAGALRVQADASRYDYDQRVSGIPLAPADHVTSYAATAYLDAPVGPVTAFVGLGGDALVTERRLFTGDDLTDSDAGWHWAAGASAAVTDRVTVDVEYRQTRAIGDAPAAPDLDTLSVGARIGF